MFSTKGRLGLRRDEEAPSGLRENVDTHLVAEAPHYRDAAFDEADADLVGVVLPDDGGRVACGA